MNFLAFLSLTILFLLSLLDTFGADCEVELEMYVTPQVDTLTPPSPISEEMEIYVTPQVDTLTPPFPISFPLSGTLGVIVGVQILQFVRSLGQSFGFGLGGLG